MIRLLNLLNLWSRGSSNKNGSPASQASGHRSARERRTLLVVLLLGYLSLATLGRPAVQPQPAAPPYSFVYPVMAPQMSSDYGWRVHPIRRFSHKHSGIDLAAPFNTPIRAVAAGRVVFADPYGGYGNFVVIQHTNSMTSHYGHCASIKVHTGQKVKAGQIIATVGSSGVSTGPHLHFEIRSDGKPINPERLIPGLASEAEG